MIRLASDDLLRKMAKAAERRSTDDCDWWGASSVFLLSIVGTTSITLRQHNWLSQLRQELENDWD